MGAPGPASEVSEEDVLAAFLERDRPSTPLTTAEVAEALDCHPETVRSTLEGLVERGVLRGKEVADAAHVWWPIDLGGTDPPGGSRHDQFGAFINAVTDYAIFRLDTDGTVASWNHGAERIKGYEESEIVGEHFSTFYTDDDVAEGVPERNLETAAAEGRVEDEGWRVREDGSRFWANVTITAIRDGEGTLQGFTKVTRDMTERREYERQLEAQADRLERQRDELERELDDVFERINDAFYALDDEFRFDYVNGTAESYFGRPAGELLGRTIWTALDVDEDDPIVETFERAMATQEPVEFERHLATLGIWATVNVYPSPTGLSVYFRDVTGRKERERELERTRSRMEFALDSTNTVVWDWNVETDRASFYPSAEALYGTAVETWADFVEVVHPEDRQKVQRGIEKALETGEPKYEEIRIVRDGEVRWIEAPGRPLHKDDDDEPTRMIGVVHDITERKERERTLQRYETLIQKSADVNAIVDPEGTLQYVTPSVEYVLGYDPEELLGEDAFEYLHQDDLEETRALFAGLVDGGEDQPKGEFRFRHADGSWVWLEAHGRNLLDDPDIDGLVVYTRDVTDRKRYEERLNATVDELEESNERLEQFAYVASHDLQEPLRMVSSYLTLLEERAGDSLDGDAREFLEFAVDGAERMREMIGGLLAYARVDTQAEPIEPTDCGAVVDRALQNLRVNIEETDAVVDVDALPTVPADESQLELVFQNLVSNAIKYRGDEPPHVEIGAERDGDTVVFRVADNGIGMEPGQADRIFEVFERLHSREEYSGTGIGLALCKKVVERHGGRIWVDSEPGEGSTFYFSLPRSETPHPA